MTPLEDMTVDQQIEFIKTELAKSMHSMLGHPSDVEAVKQVVADELHHLLTLPAGDPWLDQLASVLMLDWTGIPEGFDPKAVLATVPTCLLDEFCDRLSGAVSGASDLLALERMRRRGDVIDWSFERIDATHATTTMQLKEPLKFIQIDVTVK